jgi:hypothetical protein
VRKRAKGSTAVMQNLMAMFSMEESQSPSGSSATLAGGGAALVDGAVESVFDRLFLKFLDFFFGNSPEPKPLSIPGTETVSSASVRSGGVGSAFAAGTALASFSSGIGVEAPLGAGTLSADGGSASAGSDGGASNNLRATLEFHERYKRTNSAPDAPLRAMFFDVVALFWLGQNGTALSDIDGVYARMAAAHGAPPLSSDALPPRRELLRYAEHSVPVCGVCELSVRRD